MSEYEVIRVIKKGIRSCIDGVYEMIYNGNEDKRELLGMLKEQLPTAGYFQARKIRRIIGELEESIRRTHGSMNQLLNDALSLPHIPQESKSGENE